MDEYSAPLENDTGVTTSMPGVHLPHGEEIESSGKLTLTQTIIEKGIPQNWFFQSWTDRSIYSPAFQFHRILRGNDRVFGRHPSLTNPGCPELKCSLVAVDERIDGP